MKKKINTMLVGISAVSIILTFVLSVIVFYDLFQKQIFTDLKTYTHILRSTTSQEIETQEVEEAKLEALRITLIDPEGNVLYDTAASPEDMDNHGNRPEFREALATGEGQDIRKSETVSHNTFYYAIRLDNGNVLRVAREASSVLNIFESALPLVIATIMLLFVASTIAAHFLTRSLVSPIEQMANNMDQVVEIRTYPELKPFIDTIQKQHDDIIKNAQMRQEFTANVSHELKTPLTSISGYAELIENGMVEEKHITRFAHEIHHNAARLLTLINDTIRLSELDATEFDYTFEDLDLYTLAKNTVDMLQMNASKHQISLYFSGTEPCMVYGSKQMLEEVLYNLCDNAIRYNNVNGSVWVRVHTEGENTALVVKDTGIGIPEEHQSRVFERFYRVDKSRSKSTGGTGLGLAIVKHIVAQHNAKLNLKSTPGRGTEITIVFPKPAAEIKAQNE